MKNKTKKLLIIPALILLAIPIMLATACFGGSINRDYLFGTWYLTSVTQDIRNGPTNIFEPGNLTFDSEFAGQLTLNANGTFRDEFGATTETGNWTTSGRNIRFNGISWRARLRDDNQTFEKSANGFDLALGIRFTSIWTYVREVTYTPIDINKLTDTQWNLYMLSIDGGGEHISMTAGEPWFDDLYGGHIIFYDDNTFTELLGVHGTFTGIWSINRNVLTLNYDGEDMGDGNWLIELERLDESTIRLIKTRSGLGFSGEIGTETRIYLA